MSLQKNNSHLKLVFLCCALLSLTTTSGLCNNIEKLSSGNFGLPGIIDLPTAKQFSDGQLTITHQNHKYLFMNGISFQALPKVGVSFRYGGLGLGGGFAQNRVTWDRSFDAHISLVGETELRPSISVGLRDFIGTGWYSSEYIVATKSIKDLEITAGLGFGRLAGKNSLTNPLSFVASRFESRGVNRKSGDRGGTLGNINWFQGDTSPFFGFKYKIGNNLNLLAEYNPDLMTRERYLTVDSPWNIGIAYQLNQYSSISAQYLHGSQVSLTAQVSLNPNKPPLIGGKELAPVPMRLRGSDSFSIEENRISVVEKVLAADNFKLLHLKTEGKTVRIAIENTKFRSTAQAVGRVASTLQRFTSESIRFAQIDIWERDLRLASYQIDLNKSGFEQYNPKKTYDSESSVIATDADPLVIPKDEQPISWGIGPYITHRLFNPWMPLIMETGLEVEGSISLTTGLKISGGIRKSVLTNLTENNLTDSGSPLPRVHSNWPLYDFGGQNGHIHSLTLSYTKNIRPSVYGRINAGLLEPFFAGIGGEILFKPAQSPIAIGFDLHRVRQRDFDMRFSLQDYETTLGHVSIYYDAGNMFKIEFNAGRYLAGDWGATTTISRKFGSGWEVGGYATLTDVPFSVFGEGSFDKAIFVSIPVDWIISSPNRTRRRLTLRPITRDGGANLASARRLYRQIERSQTSDFKREFGRLWR